MQKKIERLLARSGGSSSCVVLRMEQEGPRQLVWLNADAPYPAASLAKVPILAEIARQVEAGTLSWETLYSISESARAASAGVLADMTPDLQLALHDHAHLMITISDNTAANVLLDLAGMEAVNTTMRLWGLTTTRIERHFMDVAARQAGRENWTSARDMALLFSLLAGKRMPGSQRMLDMLQRQNDTTMLPAYWGEDMHFAHKTGQLDGILHDAGIFYPPESPDNPLIIVAMTANQTDVPLTRYTLAQLGKMIDNGGSQTS